MVGTDIKIDEITIYVPQRFQYGAKEECVWKERGGRFGKRLLKEEQRNSSATWANCQVDSLMLEQWQIDTSRQQKDLRN